MSAPALALLYYPLRPLRLAVKWGGKLLVAGAAPALVGAGRFFGARRRPAAR